MNKLLSLEHQLQFQCSSTGSIIHSVYIGVKNTTNNSDPFCIVHNNIWCHALASANLRLSCNWEYWWFIVKLMNAIMDSKHYQFKVSCCYIYWIKIFQPRIGALASGISRSMEHTSSTGYSRNLSRNTYQQLSSLILYYPMDCVIRFLNLWCARCGPGGVEILSHTGNCKIEFRQIQYFGTWKFLNSPFRITKNFINRINELGELWIWKLLHNFFNFFQFLKILDFEISWNPF